MEEQQTYYYEWRKKYLLGLVEIRYWCDDRCPDLTQKQAQEKLGYKYKHQVCVRVGWKTVSWIIRSLTQGSYFNPWEKEGVHRNEHPLCSILHIGK